MAAFSCGTDAEIFGSLMMLACGSPAAILPSSLSASSMRWSGCRYSGKLAMMRPAREMSRDIRQFDDVGLRVSGGHLAELTQRVVDALVWLQVLRKAGDDAARQGNVTRYSAV